SPVPGSRPARPTRCWPSSSREPAHPLDDRGRVVPAPGPPGPPARGPAWGRPPRRHTPSRVVAALPAGPFDLLLGALAGGLGLAPHLRLLVALGLFGLVGFAHAGRVPARRARDKGPGPGAPRPTRWPPPTRRAAGPTGGGVSSPGPA